MIPKNVSVEYAHIYTNNKISEEQSLSLEVLSSIKKDLDDKKRTYSLVIMVDDYSFPDPTFDYDQFTLWLKTQGFEPDVVFRESQLIPLCDEVLNELKDKKLKEQIIDYIKTKKYPCSLFIAAWYLLRLGFLKDRLFKEDFYANKLINILPESFKPFEEKALEIIKFSRFPEAGKLIKYSYIKGRLIA